MMFPESSEIERRELDPTQMNMFLRVVQNLKENVKDWINQLPFGLCLVSWDCSWKFKDKFFDETLLNAIEKEHNFDSSTKLKSMD